MYLQDNHADLSLSNGFAKELWWIVGVDKGGIHALSDCPDNYPRTVIHTMTYPEARHQYFTLMGEGWEVEFSSPAFKKYIINKKYTLPGGYNEFDKEAKKSSR